MMTDFFQAEPVILLFNINRLTALTEHLAVKNADHRVLDTFLVGCHHRIAHAALVEWLVRNQKFQREG